LAGAEVIGKLTKKHCFLLSFGVAPTPRSRVLLRKKRLL